MEKKFHVESQVKALNEEKGTLEVVLTTLALDRDSEVVVPEGVDLSEFKGNPIVLWAHDQSIPPIGKILPGTIRKSKEELTATVQFDLDDEFAKGIFNKYLKGFLSAFSIGFIPTKIDGPILDDQRGPTFTEWKLLELSCVPVPANPEALTLSFENDSFYWDNIGSVAEDFVEVIVDKTDSPVMYFKGFMQSRQKTPLLNLIDGLDGSFEKRIKQLRSAAPAFLIENNSISEFRPDVDEVIIGATFEKEVVLIVAGYDREWSEDHAIRAKYEMSEDGAPAFKGTPKRVNVSLQVRQAAYLAAGFPKEIKMLTPPESYEDAAEKMISVLNGDFSGTEDERIKEYHRLQWIYISNGKTAPDFNGQTQDVSEKAPDAMKPIALDLSGLKQAVQKFIN